MKARDLAALAALGIAGKMAYDKFGRKKDDEPKSKGKLGEAQSANDGDAGEFEARMDNYSNEGRGKSAKFADEDYSNEGRNAKFANEDFSNEGRGKTAPVAVAKPVRTPVVTRSVAAAAPAAAAAPITSTVQDNYSNEGRNAKVPVSAQMPDATRVKAYNPDIMYNTTVPFDTSIAHNDKMNQAAYSRNKKAGVIPSQMPNDAAAARIARQSASASEIAARQAEIARKEKAFQNRVAFDPARASSTPLEHSQNVSFAKQYQRGRAKGGVVKMASGGMTSSKMSKPSGASRGDGIAQRGRTRGTLR